MAASPARAPVKASAAATRPSATARGMSAERSPPGASKPGRTASAPAERRVAAAAKWATPSPGMEVIGYSVTRSQGRRGGEAARAGEPGRDEGEGGQQGAACRHRRSSPGRTAVRALSGRSAPPCNRARGSRKGDPGPDDRLPRRSPPILSLACYRRGVIGATAAEHASYLEHLGDTGSCNEPSTRARPACRTTPSKGGTVPCTGLDDLGFGHGGKPRRCARRKAAARLAPSARSRRSRSHVRRSVAAVPGLRLVVAPAGMAADGGPPRRGVRLGARARLRPAGRHRGHRGRVPLRCCAAGRPTAPAAWRCTAPSSRSR
jgi:hypothetical protein